MLEIVETVEQVVTALGGPAKAATAANVGPSAVSNWMARGRIPSSRFFVVTEALKRKGKKASPSVFGFVEAA